MTEKISPPLTGVPETLLITLHARAEESKRPDALLHDERAVAMADQMDYDFSRLKLQGHDIVAIIMRLREFDRIARDFLAGHRDPVVVHIGCGLDTRFERVEDGRVEWYDLDLPEVVELRRKLIPNEGGRYHLLSGSVLDYKWLDIVCALRPRPFLFMAEGVFPYFEEEQVKGLFLTIQKNFPGAEIACDAQTPFIIWANNLQLAVARIKARLHWGLKHARDVEAWSAGIRLLNEYFYFVTDEPRMRPYRWMGRIPLLGRSTGIFHYRLG
jgi:O-methyltransferase involved in polyketide biosynthesis